MGSLPKGQSLADIAGPDAMRRLAALGRAARSAATMRPRHPLHLASDLRDRANGDIDYGRTAADYVAPRGQGI